MGTYRNFLVISLAVMTTGYLATPASAQPNVTANNFLHCMGLNSTDMSDSKMHEHKLRTLIGEALDIYAFLRSTYGHDSILELAAHINVSVPQDMQLQSTVFIQLWFQVKLKPLLMAVPKEALSCLGAMNFSCETYQIMVKELSDHFSSLDPARQKYIYMSFMKPFLHRMNDTSGKGCVSEENNSEAWLMKNFGAFRVLAQFKDFSTLNMAFDGLAVLHLLTPEQKAELLLHPEMGHVDNASVSLVFESLLKPLLNNEHNKPEAMVNQTSPIHNQKEGLKGFLDYLKPLGSFVKHFVSLTHKTNVSSMRSHKLTQAVLNWTLAELAGHFPKNITLKNDTKPSSPPTAETFDLTEMNDWFQHVVVPVLKRFLPHNQTEIPHDLTAIFYHVFSLNMTVSPPPFGAKDNCAINNDNICPISNTVENLAHIFGCISKTNLSVEHVGPLVNMLKDQYVNLVQSMNVTSLPETAVRPQLNSFTSESFQDVDFTNLWFYVKMRPFLPNVSAEFLSCLSTKNFSCESYTALIMGMTHYMSSMKHERQEMVYKHFIYPFLAHRQNKGMSCMANDSREWVMKNFGGFSVFAPLHNFFSLHSNFSALEAVPVLSPKQVAELVVLSHPGLPQRDVIINKVFDNLREPKDYTMFLPHLVMFVKEMPLSCPSTQLISMRLRHALSSTPKESEPAIWASMSALRHTVPGDCMLRPMDKECPFTPWNESKVCAGVDIHMLQHYLHTGMLKDVCNFSIPEYACSSLSNFTAEHLAILLKCKLSGDMTYPRETWKLFVTKASAVLDDGLAKIANMSIEPRGPSIRDFLDVTREIRLDQFSDEQLRHVPRINHWFHGNLRPLLSSVSGEFLTCLSSRNLSCETFHHVVKEFTHQFHHLDEHRKHMVFKHLIHPFLTRNHTSDPACISSTNGSAGWLHKNFGPYSALVPLRNLLMLNMDFKPLEVLGDLTPMQMADLVLSPHPKSTGREAVIHAVFDHFMETPDEKKLGEFLHKLEMNSRMANFSCETYKTILTRIDHAASSGSSDFQEMSTAVRVAMSQMALKDCSAKAISPGCLNTPVNASAFCAEFNSSTLESDLPSLNTTMMLCNGSLMKYACQPSLAHLTAENVAMLLKCKLHSNMTYSKETWKLFFVRVQTVLDEALLMFANMSHDLSNPSLPHVVDVLAEILINGLNSSKLTDVHYISKLFQMKLRPFLPFASRTVLSCLSTTNLSCETFQAIVKAMSHVYKAMDRNQQRLVYTHFIQVFLSQTDSSDPGCVSASNNSAHWLKMNFGEFAEFLNLKEIMRLNRNFSVMEALPHLTLGQLAEVAAAPGQLRTPADVHKLMKHVPDAHLGRFFDMFSPAIMGRDFPMEVRSAMLQQVLDRGNLSEPSVSDMEVQEWMQRRLKPLLPHMSKDHVKPFFNILKNRDCNISHEAVGLLDEVRSTLSNDTESEVNANIVQSLKGPDPLRCYMNDSFFLFLKKSFRGFQLPKLSTLVSLMPPPRKAELINSIEPNELSDYLKRPMVVDDDKDLCTVLTHHKKAPELLETERFPNDVARRILPCVLPLALESNDEEEVERWFDNRLPHYLQFLDKDLISSPQVLSASCLSYRKMIFVLGNRYDYNSSNITQSDVYDVIKTYLKTDDGVPKCYNATDPQLNSTAWFLNNINVFINFITEDDLGSFGSDERLQVFTVDPKNIKLFSSHNIIPDVVSVYTQLIYLQRPNFNPVKLPLQFQCDVPGQAYSQLSENEGLEVFSSLKGNCTDLDPQIEAALAGNIKTISPTVIATLGSGVTGLSTAQLTAATPTILVNSIQTLGAAPGWSKGQANAIIKVLLQGNFQVGNKDNLINLGSLIGGVPSAKISEIDANVLLETASDPVFVTNILNAPQSVKQSYVSKIITLGSSPDKLVANIPDEMVSEIPRNLLIFPSDANLALLNNINKKKWKSEQAVLFFDTVANGIDDTETLSTDILQGFTCTRVRTFEKAKVKNLIKACRRRKGRRRVKLRETQLTCMHNFIKDEKPQNFIDFPPEMLLYYNYQDVEQANCKSYFTATGYSNFNVLSAALNGKKAVLLDNAKKCLDIKQSTINRENLDVLGNMCCTLEDTYITGSDSYILEKLKNCEDFSEMQIKAMEGVLLNDTPKYGPPSKWKRKTLEELGVLPLYFTNNFWGKFKRRDTRKFLRKFLKNLRKLRTEKRKLKRLFKALLGSKFKRSADQCTVGNITQVTISDDAFPFGYDEAQFRHCLSADVVKDNLADLSEKVDDDGFQTVILDKLKEAYPSGLAEEQVTLLGSISRMASLDDISKWNITTVDTLSALMESSDGEWEAAKSKAIITKYLQTAGNTLGSSELNLIGGANLCSLDASVVKTITPDSLRDANTLDVSVCSRELKRELFNIAKVAFENRATISKTTYQLILPFLGGASLDYIKLLSTSNVSMDLSIFQSLDPDVISDLTVDDVRNLLGANLDDLKTFENATVVQDWIKEQLQSDLDRLGIGLTGGRATPTTQAPANPTTGQKPTTSGSERASRPSYHQLSVFIGVIFTALQMLK